jgi:transcriptional regulator GlxA family with amidase domain
MRSHVLAAGALAVALTVLNPSGPLAQGAAAAAVASASADRLALPAPKAGRSRPLVVIVAENAGAETTDFTIPYGVLKASGLADVRSLSTAPGPIQLRMSLKVMADQTLAEFDVAEPAGADIVIVPAQAAPKAADLNAWVKAQAAKGATIVSVCEGARVLANAGLLNGRRATTHWAAMKSLEKHYPQTTWVRDRRYVQDGPIISTTGVTASIPMSLALVEAIGGRDAAEATARQFGVADWSARHHSADFQLRKGDLAGGLGAIAAVWTHETVEAPISDGVDEVALALRADAWARSYRTKVVTTYPGGAPVRSRHGLVILPDAVAQPGRYVIPGGAGPAAPQLDATLAAMQRRYGPMAVRLATIGLEYDSPRPIASR